MPMFGSNGVDRSSRASGRCGLIAEQAGDSAALRREQIDRVQRRQHQRRDRRDPHTAVRETGGKRREHERGHEGRHDRRLLGRGQAERENRQPRRRRDEDERDNNRRVNEHFRMRLVDPPEDWSSGEQDRGHRRNPPDEQHRDGGEQQEVQRREAGAGITSNRFRGANKGSRGVSYGFNRIGGRSFEFPTLNV